MQIPKNVESVTPAWITARLAEGGILQDTILAEFSVEPITDKGITSQLARLHLTYSPNSSNSPKSMIAKFSASDPALIDLMRTLRLYEREVRFYNELAHTVDLRTPQCYYASYDGTTGLQVILLEDLTPARSGDSDKGWSLTDVEATIRELAKLHSAWWNHPDLAQKTWLDTTDTHSRYAEDYLRTYRGFLERVGDLLADDTRNMVEQLQQQYLDVISPLDEPPITIIHYDPGIQNVLFDVDGNAGSVALLDWQLMTTARGTLDFAIVMMNTLQPDVRRTHEMKLLRIYHQALVDHGVNDYTIEQAQLDYRRGVLRRFAQYVVSIGLGGHDAALDKKRKYLFPRLIAAVEDLKCSELITYRAIR